MKKNSVDNNSSYVPADIDLKGFFQITALL